MEPLNQQTSSEIVPQDTLTPVPAETTTNQAIDLEAERKEIMRRYRNLLKSVRPLFKEGDDKLVKKAFKMAVEAHKKDRRKSGEPYIYHPIAVAQIVVDEIGLGPTAVVAALLHDVVEDSEITLETIEKEFGPKIARIIDGLTKIKTSNKNIELSDSVSEQAENYRKMVLALSEDVRVIMIKLADRLHNMRTLESMQRHKQLKIISETIYIYVPIAHRLGLYNIKSELEDLYLKHQKPEVYKDIARKLERTKAQRTRYINDFIAPLKEAITKEGYDVKIFGRPKSIHSIYNKMLAQKVDVDGIYDLFAIRIIIENSPPEKEKEYCWRIFSIVTDFYKPNPSRMRDWISNPRANGYESLHATVMGPEGKWVEVQIRTRRMDDIAEKGYAAHWKYKEQGKTPKSGTYTQESGLDEWINKIRELRENNQSLSALEFLDDFRSNLYKDEVFVFTPKGDLKIMPQGSTGLDFAFEIHTDIGMSCLSVKVNGNLVPLDYVLKHGDQVEIITSRKQKPNADWLRYVKTSKAKSRIKEYLRNEKNNIITKGKEILIQKYKNARLDFNNEINTQLRNFFNYKNLSDVFYDIGKDYINNSQLNKFIAWYKQHFNEQGKPILLPAITKKADEKESKSTTLTPKIDEIIIGDEKMPLAYSLAKCCNPIPGDDVFGFITTGEGIKIHRTDCKNSVELMSKYGYRIIKAIWRSQKELLFEVALKIIGSDRMGLVRDVSKVISDDLKVNITNLSISSTNGGIFQGNIKLLIHDNAHLENLINKIKEIEGIVQVEKEDV
ncbi:MAG: RelA/SpoT family protein [Microscillaceae bacterium]|nr:RelA/SpoT family protein [Microscillaceae bacterium]MDW8459663.1 RelA/SpoT family protein [Cytophagales bacterium]